MISKERLEELIEQGSTIYEVKYGKINPVSLKNKIRFISKKYPVIVFEPRPNEKYNHHKYFDKLFETKEEAEWHKEFGCIEKPQLSDLTARLSKLTVWCLYRDNFQWILQLANLPKVVSRNLLVNR